MITKESLEKTLELIRRHERRRPEIYVSPAMYSKMKSFCDKNNLDIEKVDGVGLLNHIRLKEYFNEEI